MNLLRTHHKTLLALSLTGLFLTGCASAPSSPDGAANVRQQLTALQAEQQLSVLAPLAIKEAEQAVRVAEQPEQDLALAKHRVIMAERKVALARSQAETRQLELQRTALSQRRDEVQLDARTREANMARSDADRARGHDDVGQRRAGKTAQDQRGPHQRTCVVAAIIWSAAEITLAFISYPRCASISSVTSRTASTELSSR